MLKTYKVAIYRKDDKFSAHYATITATNPKSARRQIESFKPGWTTAQVIEVK